MAEGFSVELKGLAEVEDRLLLLGAVAGEKVMRATIFFAMKPILQQAVANIAAIPTGSGALAKATRRVYLRATSLSTATGSGSRFVMAVAPKAKDRTAIALANLKYHRKKPVRGVYWGHLVEWGFTTRNGRKIPGKGVFTRAVHSRADEAIAAFTSRLSVNVERALKKQSPE